MSLDIAKFGREPYQRLEKPQRQKSAQSPTRRYLGALCVRLFDFAVLVALFLLPVWFFDFSLNQGEGRVVLWRVSAVIILCLAFLILILGGKARGACMSAEKKIILLFSVFLCASFSLSSLLNQGAMRSSLGLLDFSPDLKLFSFFSGMVLLLALVYVIPRVEFIKTALVSWFIGSTVMAVWCFFSFFSAGGYGAISFLPKQGWLLIFAINIFLLLSFAMLQKKLAKTIWTISLLFHFAVLFLYDFSEIWWLLILGVFSLLLFQIVYAKKLWQRNFIYPLQIFIIVVLLLIVPVKMFTGKSVPEPNAYSFDQIRSVLSDNWFSVLGQGLSRTEKYLELRTVSFTNIENEDYSQGAGKIVNNGWVSLLIETGLLGILFWVLFLLFFVFNGARFLKRNFESLKEGDMPERAYLGSVFFVTIIMLAAGMWFSSLSVFLFLFFCLVLSSAEIFWSPASEAGTGSGNIKTQHNLRPGAPVALTASFAVIFLCGALMLMNIRIARAASIASDINASEDSVFKEKKWRQAEKLNPWNNNYKLRSALASIRLLQNDIPLEEQKQILERATLAIKGAAKESSDPYMHWLAAIAYKRLGAYAEGSLNLARMEYAKAVDLWPKNISLAVEASKFYRNNLKAISSGSASRQEPLVTARDWMRRALSFEPNYLPANLELALLIEQSEGPETAIEELERWEESSPEIAYHTGRLYFNMGKYIIASEKFSKVVSQVPNHSNALYSLGVCYFRMERFKDSLRVFEKVLRLNSGNKDIEEKIKQVKEKMDL